MKWKLIVSAKNQKVELYNMRDERVEVSNAAKLGQMQGLLKEQRALDPK